MKILIVTLLVICFIVFTFKKLSTEIKYEIRYKFYIMFQKLKKIASKGVQKLSDLIRKIKDGILIVNNNPYDGIKIRSIPFFGIIFRFNPWRKVLVLDKLGGVTIKRRDFTGIMSEKYYIQPSLIQFIQLKTFFGLFSTITILLRVNASEIVTHPINRVFYKRESVEFFNAWKNNQLKQQQFT